MAYVIIMCYVNIINVTLTNQLEKDRSMIGEHLLEKIVTFFDECYKYCTAEKKIEGHFHYTKRITNDAY